MKTVPQESSLTARNGKFDLKTSVEKHFMGLKYSVNRMTAEAAKQQQILHAEATTTS